MQEVLPEGAMIRKLWIGETEKYREHILRLDPQSRRSRFGGGVSDEFVNKYADLSTALDATNNTTFTGPGQYNWDFADEVFADLQRRDLVPIVDLCHFGVPDWIGDFQNADFPHYFAEYAKAFAQTVPLRLGSAAPPAPNGS